MATVVKGLASSGQDYTSLSLWEADLPADGTDAQTVEFREGMNSNGLTFDVSNLNGVPITVTVQGGQGYRYYEQPGYGTVDSVVNLGARIGTSAIEIATTDVTIEFVQAYGRVGDNKVYLIAGADRFMLRNCLVRDWNTRGFSCNAGSAFIHDCIFADTNKIRAIDANGVDVVRVDVRNTTVFSGSNVGTGYLVRNTSSGVVYCRNVISVAHASGCEACFYQVTGDNCASSDATAPGTGSRTNLAASDIFLSATDDAEDVHLKDAAILATLMGENLAGETGSTDADGNERGDHWLMGALGNAFAAARMTARGFEFGLASSGEDYTSLALWEADMPADHTGPVVAEAREVMDVGPAEVDFSNALGLEILLTVEGGKGYRYRERPEFPDLGAVAGLGARIIYSVDCVVARTKYVTVEHFEVAGGGGSGRDGISTPDASTSGKLTVRFCYIHHKGTGILFKRGGGGAGNVAHSNIIIRTTGSGINFNEGSGSALGNIIFNCYEGLRAGYATVNARNNIIVGNTNGDFVEGTNPVWTGDHNASSDLTAKGTQAVTGIVPADIFVSVVDGAEDLHLKPELGLAMLALLGGADLSAEIGSEDLDGNTRPAQWMMGPFTHSRATDRGIEFGIASSGEDYTSVHLLEADMPADPLAAVVAEYREALEDSGLLTTDFSNLNGVHFTLTVEAGKGYRFHEHASWKTNPVAVEGNVAGINNPYRVLDTSGNPHITLEHLLLTGGIYWGCQGTVNDVGYIDRCAIVQRYATPYATGIARGGGDGPILRVMNTWIYGNFVKAVGTNKTDIVLINCTVLGYCQPRKLYNCIVESTVAGLVGDHNVCGDANAPGAHVALDQTLSDWLESTTYGAENLHLKATAPGFWGADLTNLAGKYDIDGTEVTHYTNHYVGGAVPAAENGPNVKVLKSSGGDYTSLALWEADVLADPTLDQVARAEEAFALVTGTANTTIDVSNANNVRLVVTVKEGFTFRDGLSWPSVAAVSEGAWFGPNPTGGNYLYMATPNVLLEHLGFAGGGRPYGNPGGGYEMRYCILHSATESGLLYSNSGFLDALVHHCWFYGYNVSLRYGTSLRMYNSVWADCKQGRGFECNGVIAVDPQAGEPCFAFDNGNEQLSSDDTAFGTTSWLNVPSSDVLVDPTQTLDLHVKPAAAALYVGSDNSAVVGSFDIDGNWRWDSDNPWTIGANVYIVPVVPPAGPSGPPRVYFLLFMR